MTKATANLLSAAAFLSVARARAACLTSANSWESASFGTQTGSFTAQFDATPSMARMDGTMGLSNGPASTYADLAVIVRFNNTGTIDARNGAGYAAAAAIPYSSGLAYHFRLAVNAASHNYSAFVTPPGRSEQLIGSNYAFRAQQATVSTFNNVGMLADSGIETVCNWSASGGTTGDGSVVTVASTAPVQDKWGVSEIYPTTSGGKEWWSTWDNGVARSFGVASDPQDPWFDAAHGTATYSIDGKGNFFITGPTPRMYIHDPTYAADWHNVEMTVYAMRVSDQGTADAGIEGVARSNHSTYPQGISDTADLCDTRGNDARFRYDGHIDFEKETAHPNSVAIQNKTVWSGGMPYNSWIGYKLVVYDLPNGDVKLENYMDLTDGTHGGAWVLVNSLEDNGANFGVGGVPCKSGIDPALRLTNRSRLGSESGRPSMTVYWRSDNVGTNGLVYKKMSVREIDPAGTNL